MDTFNHPNVVIQKALTELQAFNSSLPHFSPPNSSGLVQIAAGSLSRWIPLPENIFKLNWDAACNSTAQKIGIGVIARDSAGNVLATLRKPHFFLKTPHTVEAMAFLATAQFACDLGFQHIILEGDALQIVQHVQQNNSKNWSEGGLIVQDSVGILDANVRWCVVHVMKREGNCPAHTLAASAISLEDELIDVECIPLCIQSLVTLDLQNSIVQ